MRKYKECTIVDTFCAIFFFEFLTWLEKPMQTESTKNSDMFNVTYESCPYNNWTSVARDRCSNPVEFHCLTDEYGRIGWVCSEPVWVEKGLLLFKSLLIDVDDVTLYFETDYFVNNRTYNFVCFQYGYCFFKGI